jgi:hypothetical protein
VQAQQRLTTIARSLLLLLIVVPPLCSQTTRMSGTVVLRAQAGSAAEEAIGTMGESLKGIDQLRLSVEGGSSRILIENAFLDILNRMGIRTVVQLPQEGGHPALRVVVLDQSIRYTNLSSGDYRREVKTSFEARGNRSDSSSTKYFGTFNRIDTDTVGFREDVGLLPATQEGDRTLFDKLVGPVVLIGGAFLIVYLFFTVRN